MTAAPTAGGGVPPIVFQRYPPLRHVLVFAILAALCLAMYLHAAGAEFQFDDEPNIVKNPAIRMETFSFGALKHAVTDSVAKNRVLVSLSFALQYWGAQYLPRCVDADSPRPDLLPWQFRLFNIFVHMFAGVLVYLLFLRLLDLPLVPARWRARAWPLAFLAALLWFCSPLQTQAVTYIVQRATAMAAMFYILALVLYLEYRAAGSRLGRCAFLGGSLAAMGASVLSKEIGATLPAAVAMIEYALIGRSSRPSLLRIGAVFLICGTVALTFLTWFFGRPPEGQTGGVSFVRAMDRLYDNLIGYVLRDEPVLGKVVLSPRQRFLTEARVVAMYESLLLFPAPRRLNLDYDFVETARVFAPGEYERPGQWAPLAGLLLVVLLTGLAPAARRARVFLGLLIGAGLAEFLCPLAGFEFPLALSKVWTNPWPLPALVWHGLALGFAAFYCHRGPLLAFGIGLFDLGQVIESSVIVLETVFEHRVYLPSIGFYLVLALLVFEALEPDLADAPETAHVSGQANLGGGAGV